MEKEFIPYEQALVLKELGFDEPCFGVHYGKNDITLFSDCIWEERTNTRYLSYFEARDTFCTAITYQQVFRWFREKYNLLGNVYSNASGWLWEIHDNEGGTHRFGSEWSGDCEESGMFTSFEKAELECLKKLMEIVKNK